MNKENKPGVDLINYLFHGGFGKPKGVENDYYGTSRLARQVSQISRFHISWSGA